MFKFIHTADIHLDSPLKGLEAHEEAPVAEIRGATRRAFANLIELAIEEEVSFVLIAGDLYDGDWRDYHTGLFFVQQMGRLQQAGIKVFLVSGNHDAAAQLTKSLPLPDNVTLFSASKVESVTLAELGVAVHGRSYAARSVTDNLASDYPRPQVHHFNIALLHTSLTGRVGHEAYAPCTPDELLAKGYDYWALGHVHQREIVAREPLIVFPGNIQGRHIRETGAKGATLVTVAEGRVHEVKECELDVLRWAECRVDVAGCATEEAVHELVRRAMEQEQGRAGGKTVAVRLHLTGSSSLHAQLHGRSRQWTEEFRAIAAALGTVWLEKVKFSTSDQTHPDELIADPTPLAGLLRTIATFELAGEDLTGLIQELASLKNKLPPGLVEGVFSPEHNRAAWHELLPEVKAMLLAKLSQPGARS